MPNFNRNDSITLTVLINQQVSFLGNASVKITPTGGTAYNITTTGSQTFGTYPVTTTLVFTCDTAGSYIQTTLSTGGGGGGTWGSITGTLSAQTDLNSSLAIKQNLLTGSQSGLVNGQTVTQVVGAKAINPMRTGIKMISVQSYSNSVLSASSFGYVAVTLPYVLAFVNVSVEAHFDSVAVIFANKSTVNSMSIVGAAVQPLPDPETGKGFNGTTGRVRLTFGGANGVTLPTLVSRTNSTNNVANIVISDFVNISSVNRTANANYKPTITIGVTLAPAAGTDEMSGCRNPNQDSKPGGLRTDFTADDNGNWWHCSNTQTATDQTMTYGAGFGLAASGYLPNVIGLIYKSRTGRIMNIVAIGDSITAGQGDGVGQGWIRKGQAGLNATAAGGVVGNVSAQLISPTPIEVVNIGTGGSQSSYWLGILKDFLGLGLTSYFNVLVAPAFSPNGGVYKSDLVNTLDFAERNNLYPMIWSGLTAYNESSGVNPVRLAVNAIAKAGDCAYMDFNATVTDGGTPGNQYGYEMLQHAYGETGFNFTAVQVDTTSLHPSTVGHQRIADGAFIPKLQALAAAYFGNKTT